MAKAKNYCHNCMYCNMISDATRYCSYIFVTGHRRPCPPGKDCTVKVPKKPKKKEATK